MSPLAGSPSKRGRSARGLPVTISSGARSAMPERALWASVRVANSAWGMSSSAAQIRIPARGRLRGELGQSSTSSSRVALRSGGRVRGAGPRVECGRVAARAWVTRAG